MCVGSSKCNSSIPSSSPLNHRRPKRSKVRVRIAMRSTADAASGGKGSEIALQNIKLYLENRCMIEENERLRRKAMLLGEENRALLSELKKKFSHLDDITSGQASINN